MSGVVDVVGKLGLESVISLGSVALLMVFGLPRATDNETLARSYHYRLLEGLRLRYRACQEL